MRRGMSFSEDEGIGLLKTLNNKRGGHPPRKEQTMNREQIPARYFETRQEAKDHLETLHKAGKEHARMIQTRNTLGRLVYKVIA